MHLVLGCVVFECRRLHFMRVAADGVLQVLETCVKNCGMRFHIFVAQKEFLQELVKLAMPRNNPPHFVLDKVLGLIQV